MATNRMILRRLRSERNARLRVQTRCVVFRPSRVNPQAFLVTSPRYHDSVVSLLGASALRLRIFLTVALLSALIAGSLPAQAPTEETAQEEASSGQPDAVLETPEEEGSQRTTLNLLGQVDTASGEGRRNENVSLTLIDNNVLKELNRRMGTTATSVTEFQAERKYFGGEFGGSPSTPLHVNGGSSRDIHGTAKWTHNNSIFSARSFFQVGTVQPARSNEYNGTLTAPLWTGANITLNGGQRKLRGQVNGNILVPGAEERTPTATDPATLAYVKRILAAFPAELPNRTDINERALNTNAPQNIDDNSAGSTFSQRLGEKDSLILRYNFTLQAVDAFQLVGGQNPNTTTRNHDARITWNRIWNASTSTDFSVGYNRVSSLLLADETSIGPTVFFNRSIDFLGPNTSVPLDRAQNTFRYAGRLQRTSGNHTINTGFDISRRQINGAESNGHRGVFSFRNDYGRGLIDNILDGTPSNYRQAFGDSHRGFRAWAPVFFVGDIWRASQRFTLNYGLRYEVAPRPREVNNLSEIPYDCDCNNFAPSFGFAYRANDRWGVFRASYSLQYGEIFAATFMQTRFNPPGILNPSIFEPSLTDPLSSFPPGGPDPNQRTDYYQLDPELSTPYSHQYNFTWELRPHQDWTVELAYIGSRSIKLLETWWINRGQPVEGIVSTTSNINERRADPRYSDVLYVLSGSRAYFDAAKATLRVPRWAGLSIDASYWFSKAMDLGGDYTNTAYSMDAFQTRSQSEFKVHEENKGLSNFDQAHALLLNTVYQTSSDPTGNRILNRVFGGWQVTGVALLKSGSPFSIMSGGDGPGFGNLDGVSSDVPNVVDVSVLGAKVNHPDTSQAALPRSAFAFQEIGQAAGNVGRNVFRKDGVWNVNTSMARRFAIRGDMTLQFVAESLNLFNHAQFQQPGQSLSETNFGQITNTLNDGRTFQFTLSLSF